MSGKLPYPPCEDCDCTGNECLMSGHSRFKVFGDEGIPIKMEWPELVGVAGEKAILQIEHDNPFVTVLPMPPGMIGIGDICCNRVYLWLNKSLAHGGVVVKTPKVG